MKIHIVGSRAAELQTYIRTQEFDFVFDTDEPEVVIAYGGDGTLLSAERLFPGIPKVMIRASRVCTECVEKAKKIMLSLLARRAYQLVEQMKLSAQIHHEKIVALNDIVVGHVRVNGTLRFRFAVDNAPYEEEVFGDGVVVSTPLGSTGYYQTITRNYFSAGMGIAFNNPITAMNHLVVSPQSTIVVEITRGQGLVAADNDERELAVAAGDRITISAAEERARFVEFAPAYAQYNMLVGRERIPLGFCQICGIVRV
ncbi:MAG: NAD(+)/NADH kinase [Candidatus Kerfeldbacteria bacterium]|nr:NAD(+)/NADH kinase [Candidatus Kerfeldbacteria bacterium]